MAIKTRIRDKYQIGPHTWQHLKKMYWIVFFSPLMFSSAFAMIIWVVFKFAESDISWLLYLLSPWMLIFSASIVMYRQFFILSKITVMARASIFCAFQFTLFLCVIVGAFELFGHYGIYLNLLFLSATIYLFYKWMKHWEILWESNQFCNENTVIDPENARYEIINGFNYDDKKARRRGYRPFIGKLTSTIGLILYPAIIILDADGGEFLGFAFVYVTMWFSAVFFYFALTYATTALFHTYGKIVHFEKALGKPIVNGLLDG